MCWCIWKDGSHWDSVDVGRTVEKEIFASSKEMNWWFWSSINQKGWIHSLLLILAVNISVNIPDLTGGTDRSVIMSFKFGETNHCLWRGQDNLEETRNRAQFIKRDKSLCCIIIHFQKKNLCNIFFPIKYSGFFFYFFYFTSYVKPRL